MKLLVLDNIGSFTLVPYLKARLPNHEVFKMGSLSSAHMINIYKRINPDVVFVDFCDQNAIVMSNLATQLPKPPRIVIRLHRYEAHSKFIYQVNWKAVSELIVVSPEYKRIVQEKIPGLNPHIVYNGIDLQKFKLYEGDRDLDSIAYVGYLNGKKGPALLRTLIKSIPYKNFCIGGKFNDETVGAYFDMMKLKNASFAGWIDPTQFLKGKGFILSTSVTESFGMSIGEAMAMGLTPAIHEWPGADKLWPMNSLWSTIDELKLILSLPQDPKQNRDWIESRYSMDKCVTSVVSLLGLD